MNYENPPTLKEFAETFNEYLNDIGCMNNPDGFIGSHNIVGDIDIRNDDPNEDNEYIITGIDFRGLMGCGCPADIIIRFKKL